MRAGGSFEPACASLVRGGQRQERGVSRVACACHCIAAAAHCVALWGFVAGQVTRAVCVAGQSV